MKKIKTILNNIFEDIGNKSKNETKNLYIYYIVSEKDKHYKGIATIKDLIHNTQNTLTFDKIISLIVESLKHENNIMEAGEIPQQTNQPVEQQPTDPNQQQGQEDATEEQKLPNNLDSLVSIFPNAENIKIFISTLMNKTFAKSTKNLPVDNIGFEIDNTDQGISIGLLNKGNMNSNISIQPTKDTASISKQIQLVMSSIQPYINEELGD